VFARLSTADRRRCLVGLAVAAALVAAGLIGSTSPAAALPQAVARHGGLPGRGNDASVPRAAVAPIPASAGRGAIQGSVTPTPNNLPRLGYTEREFSVSGTASGYTADGALGADGLWKVTPTVAGPYRTRMIVRRPSNPARFNGTVVVEWLNVSFGVDIPVEWGQSWQQFTRAGYAYVGISAQKVGIDRLTTFDPGRYGTLTTPNDGASYDIFSQSAKAVRDQASVVLGGLRPRRLIGVGHSQSAGRLVTYVDAIQPRSQVFDGFLIHGRFSGSAPLGEGFFGGPPVAPIRPDLGVPVLQVESETDLTVFAPARQADSAGLRTWEVAGTSHADQYLVDGLNVVNAREKITDGGAPVTCDKPLNDFPYHWASNAAYAALDRWIRAGHAPAKGTPFVTAGTTLVRDARGNVEGGVRLPDIEAPIATYGPTNAGGSVIGACLLLGTTTPFDATTLAALYPDRHAYLRAYVRSAVQALRSGFLLPADYRAAVAAATHRHLPN
jgi:hypothetical protein